MQSLGDGTDFDSTWDIWEFGLAEIFVVESEGKRDCEKVFLSGGGGGSGRREVPEWR